jgi:hypothetical protein
MITFTPGARVEHVRSGVTGEVISVDRYVLVRWDGWRELVRFLHTAAQRNLTLV